MLLQGLPASEGWRYFRKYRSRSNLHPLIGTTLPYHSAAQMVIHAVVGSFGLALRIAAPFVITCLVWQAALGFVSRLVPNIQVHVISAPAQILGGLVLLGVAIIIMFANWSAEMQQAFSSLPGL